MQRFCVLLLLIVSPSFAAAQNPNRAVGLELFEKKIRPALIEHCYECHSADSDDVGGNLLLDSRSGVSAGGESGPALVAGKPKDSLLLRALEYRDLEMPPDEKLPDSVIADFRRWIALGAPDPRDASSSAPKKSDVEEESAAATDLWSLKPLSVSSPPSVADPSWPRSDADRFVLASLEANGLVPNADVDPGTLLRRIYFDLIGLPPSPGEVESFVSDPSQQRLAQVVDQLLGWPQFGERWGRHWLDVARYAESAGSSRDVLTIYAWRYRDFVIDAFNEDMPFDHFIRLQVAGDLLPATTADEKIQNTVATGLLAIGSKSLNGGNLTYDVIDDQIDVVSKSILGLTVSCARCHDHKFDPIPTKDYYSLAGIFLSTETLYGGGTKRPKNPKERAQQYLVLSGDVDPEVAKAQAEARQQVATLEKQVSASQKRVKTLLADVPKEFRGKADTELENVDAKVAQAIRKHQAADRILKQRLEALEQARQKLGEEPEYAVGVRDAKKITDARILLRGEKNQPGEVTPRGFLSALGERCASVLDDPIDESQSGRRQLASWLVHPENPLAPRVAVNRIWQHLMGSGLVATVDNFGAGGQRPSHPELLDYLAHRFIHTHRWSTKAMIRELVLSRTYQLSSEMNPAAFQVDPDNRLRWRMPRRRLEAEPLRDAMLAAGGLLDLNRPQGSLVMQIGEGEVGRNLNTAVLDKPFDHRSVYLPIIRGIIPEQLKLFDFPEPSNVRGLRDSNTTPTQSLFLMNSQFAIRAAGAMAERVLSNPALATDRDRIRAARAVCFSSQPTDEQIDRDWEFVSQMLAGGPEKDAEAQRLAWIAYCQSLMASAKFRFID